MTLPASPPITAQDINVELGRAATAPFSIDGAEERALAGVPSGAISFSDFLGKSNVLSASFVETTSGNNNTGSFSINIDIGAGHANKTVFIVGHTVYNSGVTLASLNSPVIGGVAASVQEFVSIGDGSAKGLASWIISAEVSTAGTVAVTGTYSSAIEGDTHIASYFTNSDFTVTEALGIAVTDAGSPYTTFVQIDVAEGGTVIAGGTSSINSADMVWAGIAVESYDNAIAGDGPGKASGGLQGPLSAQSNRTMSVTQSTALPLGAEGISVVAITIVKA